MSDVDGLATTDSYSDFLREVFIEPIRTAVVVDDEYPTLDELLRTSLSDTSAGPAISATVRQNTTKLQMIVGLCRDQKPTPWLVDVHNGTTPTAEGEVSAASHFDHTDLLILDYHLDKDEGSEKSIEILRRLAGNDHFNLVVVYTRARQESGGIEQTIREIALSLASPKQFPPLVQTKLNDLQDQFENWEGVDEGIFNKLLAALDDGALLKILARDSMDWSECQLLPEIGQLAALFETRPNAVNLTMDHAFRYLVEQKQRQRAPAMSERTFGSVELGINEDINWIRTDSLFVTVISKDEAPAIIPQKLLTALEASEPKPQRLIVSKMRAELSARGGAVESNALRNPYLQSAWLDDLLEKNREKRRTNVRQDVTRQWENLGSVVWPSVLKFSERLANFLVEDDPLGAKRRSIPRGSIEETMVYLHFNRYVCSKVIEGHHLSTGHILRVGTEYWLCLTPVCDLEPGQGANKGWKSLLGEWMPLKAVQLSELKLDNEQKSALKNAVRANYLYVEIDGELKVFGLGSGDSNPTLLWEQFFAKDCGAFALDAQLKLGRVAASNDELNVKFETATVVAQLRYEYALNLLQRLGSQLSRVGLDFRKYPA